LSWHRGSQLYLSLRRKAHSFRSRLHPGRRQLWENLSPFAASAEQFVQRGSPIKVVLIDGHALLDLMMRYKVGVRVERSVEVLDIDQNYFSEE
jgi:restriction endonuclease Mrr